MKQALQKLKLLAKIALGRELRSKPTVKRATERLGSQFSGWEFIPAEIDQHSIIYSFGVGEDITFDLELAEKFGATIHAFDPTPRAIQFVASQTLPPKFFMHAYGIAAMDGEISFNPPKNPKHVSYTILDRPETSDSSIVVPVKRLSTIAKELEHDRIDVLKLDIEGAEYDVISDMVNSSQRPRQLLIEFHHRFPNVGIVKTKTALAQLYGAGYALFAVSSTNEEYSLIHLP
jgi:FkbM family methyltransferase